MEDKIDWSQYEVKGNGGDRVDWSQFEVDDDQQSSIAPTPFNRQEPMELELSKSAQPKETLGWKGLGKDAIDMLQNALNGAIGFGRRAPGNLKEIGSDLLKHPLSTPPHIAQQVLAGLGEGVKGLANIPHEIFDELANKEITPNWLRTGSIPEDTGVEKFLGLEPTKKSDELLRALPAIYGGGKLLAKPLGAAKRKLTAPSKERLFQRALEERIDQAGEKVNMSTDQLNALKDQLKLQYSEQHPGSIGEISPVGQKVAINEKSRQIGELSDNAAKAPEGEIPPEPDVKSAEKSLADALESTRAHEKHGGRLYQKALEEDKAATSKLYDDYRGELKRHDLKVDNTAEIKDVSQKLTEMKDNDELAPGYGSGTAEQKALESQLKSLDSETVNAEDVFAVKRTLDHMADATRDKQYSGVDDTEFKRLRLIAERLESKSSKLNKVLESVGTPETRKMIKMANQGWAKYSAAKNHPVGRKALKEGLLTPNTMGKLESTGLGSEYLKSIRDSDLQLQKHILSQKYGKPSQFKHLLEPKEEVEPYLANREDLHPHIENLRDTKHAKEQHQALVSAMKDKAKVKSLEEQIKFHTDAIPKVEAKMKDLDVNSAEHKRLQKELDSHRKHIQDKNYLLKKVINATLKLTGANTLLHKFGL